MNQTKPHIFGNSDIYARLCFVTEVLGIFVSSAPRGVALEQLSRLTGRTEKELARLCSGLCREQLVRPCPAQPHRWQLLGEASLVTLEDAFRYVLAEQALRGKSARQRAAQQDDVPREAGRPGVDLLVMQAAMGINQSVFQHLRQFSLDRLKVATGMFPTRSAAQAPPHGWTDGALSFS